MEGEAEVGDFFGFTVSAGDFNGDGRKDLIVGAPGEDIGRIKEAGLVHALYGSQKNGVQSFGDQIWHQNTSGIDGLSEAGDQLGGWT